MDSQKNICLASVGFCSTGQYGHFNLKHNRTHTASILNIPEYVHAYLTPVTAMNSVFITKYTAAWTLCALYLRFS